MLVDFEKLETLDTQGLFCPEPIMLLHSKVDDINSGEQLLVLASDPATKRDIPKFCQFLGHSLILEEEVDQVFRYVIQKS
tara:strand:+ start:543 stop:782 length:240 start_codon:yes stop_codon:yes gene_type:complete